jgi:GT2 family glycosyltransferase/nucleoside-diphosphate-sugar epimerase
MLRSSAESEVLVKGYHSVRPGLVSVVIVNYNAGTILTYCVNRVLASTVDTQVIVVDNASQDGSLDLLCSSLGSEQRLTIIENASNVGFAAGCNIAIQGALGEYILVLNPDCLVEPGTVATMREFMTSRPDVAVAGCLIRNPDGTEQAGCRRSVPTPWRSCVRVFQLSKLFPRSPRFRSFVQTGSPLPTHPVEVEAISGAFMFVRRSAMEQVGTFDPQYFMHCEDLDWCIRFTQAGYKIAFVPGVSVVHLKGVSTASRPLRVEWYKHRGMLRFYRKFFWDSYPVALRLIVIPAVLARFVLKAAQLLILKAIAPKPHTVDEWIGAAGVADRMSAGQSGAGPANRAASYEEATVITDRGSAAEGAALAVGHRSAMEGTALAAGHGSSAQDAGGVAGRANPAESAAGASITTRTQPVAIVLGAGSQVGHFLLPRLAYSGYQVAAFTRGDPLGKLPPGERTSFDDPVVWVRLGTEAGHVLRGVSQATVLFHLAPLPVLVPLIEEAVRCGVRRIIAFGSTSRFTKADSGDPHEQDIAQLLADSEQAIASKCESLGIAWTIFRPTLIYGCGRDRNVTIIARFARRFGFFPMVGEGMGRRQPVHGDDLAAACLKALECPATCNRAYNLSGGETLTYRQMVETIFESVHIKPRIVRIGPGLFHAMLSVARIVPRYRGINMQMVARMERDLCFDHGEAARDFGFRPRSFEMNEDAV